MSAQAVDALQHEERDVRDAYGIALVALFVSTLMLVALDSDVASVATFMAMALQVTALVLTMRVSGAPRRFRTTGIAVAVVLFAVGVLGGVVGDTQGYALLHVGWLLLVLATIVAILRRLSQYRKVTLPLVMGLLCIYLLLGIAFGLSYSIVDVVAHPAFAGGERGISSAVYYSFITLATVGYGDITPGSTAVRAIAVAEAILGQLYLVSVVAAAVSRLGAGRPAQRIAGEGAEDPGTS